MKIGGVTVRQGDCLEVLRSLPDSCVDAIITDTDRLAEVAKEAARDMASDWYCPSDPGWRRRDCPECVAAVVAAALAPVVEQIAARRAAKELREMATVTVNGDDRWRLRDRAAELSAAALAAAAPTERTDR